MEEPEKRNETSWENKTARGNGTAELSEREKMKLDFYNTYDSSAGVRIAVTLSTFFALLVLLVVYKSKCKSRDDESTDENEALAAAAIAAEEAKEEMELRQMLCSEVLYGGPPTDMSQYKKFSSFAACGSKFSSYEVFNTKRERASFPGSMKAATEEYKLPQFFRKYAEPLSPEGKCEKNSRKNELYRIVEPKENSSVVESYLNENIAIKVMVPTPQVSPASECSSRSRSLGNCHLYVNEHTGGSGSVHRKFSHPSEISSNLKFAPLKVLGSIASIAMESTDSDTYFSAASDLPFVDACSHRNTEQDVSLKFGGEDEKDGTDCDEDFLSSDSSPPTQKSQQRDIMNRSFSYPSMAELNSAQRRHSG